MNIAGPKEPQAFSPELTIICRPFLMREPLPNNNLNCLRFNDVWYIIPFFRNYDMQSWDVMDEYLRQLGITIIDSEAKWNNIQLLR